MFFFIGGIQPKTVTVDDQPRMCPSCGLYRSRLKRVDHYVSVFFIPLFPVKRGMPFLQCESCGSISRETGEIRYEPQKTAGRTCPYCGESVESSFRFCPSCGKRL